jgi:hypothetical protein
MLTMDNKWPADSGATAWSPAAVSLGSAAMNSSAKRSSAPQSVNTWSREVSVVTASLREILFIMKRTRKLYCL